MCLGLPWYKEHGVQQRGVEVVIVVQADELETQQVVSERDAYPMPVLPTVHDVTKTVEAMVQKTGKEPKRVLRAPSSRVVKLAVKTTHAPKSIRSARTRAARNQV